MMIRLGFCSVLLWVVQIAAYAESHHPQDFLHTINGSKNEGEQIYQHFCVNCHAIKPLISIGAPAIGVKEDWQTRIKQGINTLFKHSDEGLNAMPPRGGCFECTDKQLMLAIEYMLPKSDEK